MKIFQVISDSNIGGAGVLVKRICEALADEFEFTVVVPKGAELKRLFEREEERGYSAEKNNRRRIRIIEMAMGCERSFRLWDVERFRELFLREKPDVVHTHAVLSARIGARLAGVDRILSTRHCAKETGEKRSFLYTKIYNMVTDVTVSTAQYAKRNLIEEGVFPEKICVIENGSPMTPRTSLEDRVALKERLGIPMGAVVLGSVARLERVKGQDLMIEALAVLVHEWRSDLHLVLVGTGSAGARLQEMAQERKLRKRVHFVGYTDGPYRYQNIFDINLNASRGTETSCLATSECMSLGIVTVASDFGGNPEMVRHGVSGLIFPSEDVHAMVRSIRLLLENPKLTLALSSGARLLYEKVYSIERMAEKYKRLYRI